LCLWLGAALLLSSGASATTIVLSQFSSDETDPSVLDATLDLGVAGTTLTVTLTNDTTAPFEYSIISIAFNSSSDITGLALSSASGSGDGVNTGSWSLGSGGMDGFGSFDHKLSGPVDMQPASVLPGETQTFTLTFTCLGTCDMSDFGVELSTVPPGNIPSLAAAQFVSGPGDDSAFGATVPEPGTVSLLALGLAGLAIRARARAA
jgi:hypothetical protein